MHPGVHQAGMIVEFRDENDEELRIAGLDAVPRTFESVQLRGTEYMVKEVCWNLSPSDGSTDGIDVTVWLE